MLLCCWHILQKESPLRVHTHQQSQVESNPVQSDSQTRQRLCGLLTLATVAELSQVTRVLPSQES
jgi:hypothetical protein